MLTAHPALVRELEDPLGARVHRPVNRVAEARDLVPAAWISSHLSRPRPDALPPRATARTTRTCRAPPGRRRSRRDGARSDPGRLRASSARRRYGASSRARRSLPAAGRGRTAGPRSAPAGQQQVEVLREAEPAHQVAGEVTSPILHPVWIGLAHRVRGPRRPICTRPTLRIAQPTVKGGERREDPSPHVRLGVKGQRALRPRSPHRRLFQ